MLFIYVLCVVATSVAAQSLSDGLSETLLGLIAEERQLRAQLENEANLLEKRLDALDLARQNATCGCPVASSSPVAFSTTLGHNINTLGTQQAIVYDTVSLNVGDAYDSRHGVFTAPLAGSYEFTAAVLNAGGRSTGLEIVKNGEVVAKIVSGDSSYYTMGTNAVALRLAKGDEVWVRHSTSDSNDIRGESTTSFSGYLIDV